MVCGFAVRVTVGAGVVVVAVTFTITGADVVLPPGPMHVIANV